MEVKKRKATYKAFQVGEDSDEVILRALQEVMNAHIDEHWDYKGGIMISQWKQSENGYVDTTAQLGD